jgi:hypothetical protein
MIPRGATQPSLRVTITPDGRVPTQMPAQTFGCQKTASQGIDLTDASVKFEMYNSCQRSQPQLATLGQVVIVDAPTGVVEYHWHPSDTSIQGCYYGRFVVTFADNTIAKWPYQLEALMIEVT